MVTCLAVTDFSCSGRRIPGEQSPSNPRTVGVYWRGLAALPTRTDKDSQVAKVRRYLWRWGGGSGGVVGRVVVSGGMT
jgi:hypothetical protein